MTSASTTSAHDPGAGHDPEVDPTPTGGRQCEACPHPWEDHDAIGRRYCTASLASGRTAPGCVCRH